MCVHVSHGSDILCAEMIEHYKHTQIYTLTREVHTDRAA